MSIDAYNVNHFGYYWMEQLNIIIYIYRNQNTTGVSVVFRLDVATANAQFVNLKLMFLRKITTLYCPLTTDQWIY